MSFDNSVYLWLLIIIPFVIVFGIMFFQKKQKNFNYQFGKQFFNLKKNISYTKQYMKFSFFVLSLIFLTITLASPMYGESSRVVEKTGIDIVFAIDTSKSMLAEDIAPSRIERAKMELSSFIKSLKGDRVGIVSFSGVAYPLLPLTTDYSIAQLFLKNISTDDIPIRGTNISMAVETAMDLFSEGSKSQNRSRILIIVSDGESHDGNTIESAKKARENGITIYTFGIGSLSGELIPIKNKNGQNQGYVENKQNEPVITKLNSKELLEISTIGGGKYYGFEDNSIDLSKLLGEISQFERKSLKDEFKILKQERYQIPLFAAFVFLLLSIIISEKKVTNNKKEGI